MHFPVNFISIYSLIWFLKKTPFETNKQLQDLESCLDFFFYIHVTVHRDKFPCNKSN
jgi:hypothetical protein